MYNPRQIYKLLSSSNKVKFWEVTVSCVVTIITFWLGLSYQYIVVDESTRQNKNLTHISFIKEYCDIGNTALIDNTLLPGIVRYKIETSKSNKALTTTQEKTLYQELKTFIPQNEDFDVFLKVSEEKVNAVNKLKYCFEKEACDSISVLCSSMSNALMDLYFLNTDSAYTEEEFEAILRIMINRLPVNKSITVLRNQKKQSLGFLTSNLSNWDFEKEKINNQFKALSTLNDKSNECAHFIHSQLKPRISDDSEAIWNSWIILLLVLIVGAVIWWLIIIGIFRNVRIINPHSEDEIKEIVRICDEALALGEDLVKSDKIHAFDDIKDLVIQLKDKIL